MRPAKWDSKIFILSSNNSNDNVIDVEWPVLPLYGQRDNLKTFFSSSSYPNHSSNLNSRELIAD